MDQHWGWPTRWPSVPQKGPAQSKSQAMAMSSLGPPRTREPSAPHPLTTVVQLGMSLTEFFTSSSVTSTTLQCSSSEGRGSSPLLVTQGCNCGIGKAGRGQIDRYRQQWTMGIQPAIALRGPKAHKPQIQTQYIIYISWCRAL